MNCQGGTTGYYLHFALKKEKINEAQHLSSSK